MDKIRKGGVRTKFASREEALSPEYISLVRLLDEITVRYQLPDHSDVNQERYPWSLDSLSRPAFYAARMWEYPFALISAELQPGMRCADVGCGMTAFTIYLKEGAGCHVVGMDPDIFEAGIRYKGHGVSQEFVTKTGLEIVQCSMNILPFASNSFDRVFCLSVIEHLPVNVARRGVQEISRILKVGGRAVITVDVNMLSEITRPLDLIWESGLLPFGEIDLRWPSQRFGIFCDGQQPADVFGMTLTKDDYPVETEYSNSEGKRDVSRIPASQVPAARWEHIKRRAPKRPLWWRTASRLKKACLILLRG